MKFPRLHGIQALLSVLLVGVVLAGCDGSGPAPQTPVAPTQVQPTSTTPIQVTPTDVGQTPTSTGPLTKVRIGFIPVMIYAPIFVANERGYFAQEGIELELTSLQGGSDTVVQLAAGNFDAGIGGAGAGLFNAANRGVKFTIVAPMHSEQPPVTSPLVISAKRANEIKSVADLRGKKVSINATGAATEYWLAQALERGGLTINDVQLTTVRFPDVPAALESGSLDAAILGEPFTTINEDNGLVKVLSEDFINGFYSTYLYFGEPMMQKDELARGFMRAYLRACRDLQGKYMNQEIASIIEKYTKVPADVNLRASTPQYDPNGRVPIENLNTLQTYFLQRGSLLEYKEPLDISKLVNTQLAAEVAAELDKR